MRVPGASPWSETVESGEFRHRQGRLAQHWLARRALIVNAESAAALYLGEGGDAVSRGALSEGRLPASPRQSSGPGVNTKLHSESTTWGPASDADGRRAAFEAELERCRPEVLNWLCRRVHDPEAAADITQEACLRMMKYRDDPGIGDPRLMLFRIANNLASDFARYQHRHHVGAHVPLDEAGPLFAPDAVQEELMAASQIAEAFKQAIRELPPKCRLAFTLNRYDGLSNAQIAARLDISVKAVEKHITRAIVACRAAVGRRIGATTE